VPPFPSFDATHEGGPIPILLETAFAPPHVHLCVGTGELHSGSEHICAMPGGAGSPIVVPPPCGADAHILPSFAPEPPVYGTLPHEYLAGAPAQIESGAEPETSGDEQEHVGSRDLRQEANSLRHMLTHNPKNPHCPICQVAKAQQRRHLRGPMSGTHGAEQFGDCITADYFVFDRGSPDAGIENLHNGLVILDIATTYLDCEPLENRDTEMTEMTLRCFAGGAAVKRFYSDNDGAFVAAAKRLCWKHDSSKPHDPQSNGLIETHVRLVKDGARSLLYQAGMPAMCWPWAVKYFCHMRNMQGKHSRAGVDLESAYFRRYGTEYDGLRVPFGALVEFLPTSKFAKDDAGAMSPKTVPGIFIGYYENSHSITKDYIVISLAYLYDAKMQPNDRDSWRLTPQRVGRIFFRQDQIRFPLKAAYDVRRESILQCDVPSGPLPSVLWGNHQRILAIPFFRASLLPHGGRPSTRIRMNSHPKY
jgi:hypothetical protein